MDQANRLHFYVLDVRRDRAGVLSYTIAVRSLDGAGAQRRGVAVRPATAPAPRPGRWTKCVLPVRNTGAVPDQPSPDQPSPDHPEDATAYLGSDVYRVSAGATGQGWTAWLPRTVVTAGAGEAVPVTVYVHRGSGASRGARVPVTVTSESDPTRTSTGTCRLS